MNHKQKTPFNDGYRPKTNGYQPQNLEKKGYQPPKGNGGKQPPGTPPQNP